MENVIQYTLSKILYSLFTLYLNYKLSKKKTEISLRNFSFYENMLHFFLQISIINLIQKITMYNIFS